MSTYRTRKNALYKAWKEISKLQSTYQLITGRSGEVHQILPFPAKRGNQEEDEILLKGFEVYILKLVVRLRAVAPTLPSMNTDLRDGLRAISECLRTYKNAR